MEAEREELISKAARELDETIAKYEAEKEDMAEEIAVLQRDRDESLLQAENDKQQVCVVGG